MRISDWSSDVCSSDLRDPLLEHRDGRVLQARIGHALFVARETPRDFLGAFVGVSRGQEEGFRRLAMLAAPGAAAHRLGRGMPALCPATIDRKSTRLNSSH